MYNFWLSSCMKPSNLTLIRAQLANGCLFKGSLANFGDRYQKTIWLGFISDQKSTLDLMPDIQLQKWIPSIYEPSDTTDKLVCIRYKFLDVQKFLQIFVYYVAQFWIDSQATIWVRIQWKFNKKTEHFFACLWKGQSLLCKF